MSNKCCCVCGSNNEDGSLSFFRLPTALKFRNEWCKNLNIARNLNHRPYICSSHFTSDQFITFKKDRLKNDAIPTLYKDKAYRKLQPNDRKKLKNTQRLNVISKVVSLETKLLATQTKLNLVFKWIKNRFEDDESLPALLSQVDDTTNIRSSVSKQPINNEEKITKIQKSKNVNILRKSTPNYSIENPINVNFRDEMIVPDKDPLEIKEEISSLDTEALANNCNASPNSIGLFIGTCSICNLMFDSANLLFEHQMSHCYVRLTRINMNHKNTIFIKDLKLNSFNFGKYKAKEKDQLDSDDISLASNYSSEEDDPSFDLSLATSENFSESLNASDKRLKQNIRRIGKGEHICLYCKKRFTEIYTLKLHKKKFHLDELNEEDRKIINKFNRKKPISYTKRYNANGLLGNYQCSYCDKKMLFRKSLKNHTIRFHLNEITEEDKEAYILNLGRKLKTKDQSQKSGNNLKRTSNTKGLLGDYQCSYCDKKMLIQKSLKNHTIRFHLDEITEEDKEKYDLNNISCPYCQNEITNNVLSIERHYLSQHVEELTDEDRIKYVEKQPKKQVNLDKTSSIHFYEEEINGNTVKTYFKIRFRCTLCTKRTKNCHTTDDLASHLKDFHNCSEDEISLLIGPQDFNCRFESCQDLHLNKKTDFIVHMLKTHFKELTPGEKDDNLNLIKKLYANNQKISENNECGADEKTDKTTSFNFFCIESECDAKFSYISQYYYHLVKTHKYLVGDARKIAGVKNYKCNYCPREYMSKNLYQSHLASNHINEVTDDEKKEFEIILKRRKFYTCVDCKLNFRSVLETYKNHMKLVHYEKYVEEFGEDVNTERPGGVVAEKINEENPLVKCDKCDKFLLQSSIRSHTLRVHTKIENHLKCPEEGCNYRTYLLDRLVRHKDTHSTEKLLKCSLCQFITKRTQSLTKHIRINHSTVQPNFTCDQCGASFNAFNNLTKHLKLVHENLRPYACPVCDTRFKTTASLKYHVKTHDNPNSRKRGLNKDRVYKPRRKREERGESGEKSQETRKEEEAFSIINVNEENLLFLETLEGFQV